MKPSPSRPCCGCQPPAPDPDLSTHVRDSLNDYAKAFDRVDHNKPVWKILKEMGIPDHLTCLLKEYVKAVYCHPAYLTYMQGTS